MMKYKRILLKLSGESLQGKAGYGLSPEVLQSYAEQIRDAAASGAQIGIVIGGGNIFRGLSGAKRGFDRVKGDQMGMLATIINALAVREALERVGRRATVFTAQEMTRFAELYRVDRADACLNAGEIVLLAGGSGNPFFTTDTAAALRAAELRADAVFKGTTVDGVYDSDPHRNPNAKLLSELTYQEALDRDLKVMDATAFRLCMEQKLPCIRVFNMDNLENILAVARGETVGTVVHA